MNGWERFIRDAHAVAEFLRRRDLTREERAFLLETFLAIAPDHPADDPEDRAIQTWLVDMWRTTEQRAA